MLKQTSANVMELDSRNIEVLKTKLHILAKLMLSNISINQIS